MTQRAFPILFITATRIGDAVLSSGLIKMLADQIPADKDLLADTLRLLLDEGKITAINGMLHAGNGKSSKK